MTLTKHGHHIQGSPSINEQTHPMVHRCGGPLLCDSCASDEAKYWHPTNMRNRRSDNAMSRSLEILLSDVKRAEEAGDTILLAELRGRIEKIANGTADCPTCTGPVRQTVGMKCPDCGKDYS